MIMFLDYSVKPLQEKKRFWAPQCPFSQKLLAMCKRIWNPCEMSPEATDLLQPSYLTDGSPGNGDRKGFSHSHTPCQSRVWTSRLMTLVLILPLDCCDLSCPLAGLPLLPLPHFHNGKALWLAARDQSQIYVRFF